MVPWKDRGHVPSIRIIVTCQPIKAARKEKQGRQALSLLPLWNIDIVFRVPSAELTLESNCAVSLFPVQYDWKAKQIILILSFLNTCGFTTGEQISPNKQIIILLKLPCFSCQLLKLFLYHTVVFCTTLIEKHIDVIGSRTHFSHIVYTSPILIFNHNSIILWKISKDFGQL